VIWVIIFETAGIAVTAVWIYFIGRDSEVLRNANNELRKENQALIFALGRKPSTPVSVEEDNDAPAVPQRKQRVMKRQGFSQLKRQTEAEQLAKWS